MTMLTVESVAALGPCQSYHYDDCARLRALFGRRRRVAVRTALRDRRVPAEDRVWLGIALLPSDADRRMFAADCAERALLREREAGREPDPRSWVAVEVARRHARGEATDVELAAAEYAARAAAWDAAWAAAGDAAWVAWDAAWAAARAAAWDAAWAAIWAVARDAAWDAAWAAAGDAAWDAEREWQVERLAAALGAAP